MPTHWFAILTAVVSAGIQFVAFVRDIATNHLPHIYTALHEIAKRQGIDLPETPMVRFVDLNGHRRRS